MDDLLSSRDTGRRSDCYEAFAAAWPRLYLWDADIRGRSRHKLLRRYSVGTPSGINNQPQAAGSSAGNATSSQPATPASAAHLGDTVAIRGNGQEQLSVQLVKVVDPATGADEFTQPDAGKHFVAVQFKLTNSGPVAYSDAPDNDAKVLDAQGQSFESAIFDTTAGPGFARATPPSVRSRCR